MKEGIAIENGTLFLLDENGNYEMEVSEGGAPVLKKCLKCVHCGHSISF